MKMDVSKFKKISSDKTKTVLKHPRGHQIVIAHDSVSPSTRKQLHALPGYAGGGGVKEEDTANDVSYPVQQSSQDSDNSVIEQAPENRLEQAVDRGEASPTNPKPIFSNANTPEPEAAPAAPAPARASMDPAANRAPAQVPENQPPDAQNMPPQNAIQGSNIAPADAQAASQDKQAAQNYQKGFEDYHRANAQRLGAEDAAWQHDLSNGHVTPQTYQDLFAKRDTLGKIGMIFGMLMSGAGSGLAHQQNSMLAMMNNEIQNDYNAQVQSKGNAKNFLDLHRQQQLAESQIQSAGIEREFTKAHTKSEMAQAEINAQAATLMKMNRTALHDLVLKTQMMPPGPQKSQAEAALAMVSAGVDQKNFNIADVAAGKAAFAKMIGGGSNTTLLKTMPGMEGVARDIEEKSVPGVGRAQIPVPQETRDRLTALQQYDEKAKEYVNFAKQHSGNWANLNPIDRQKIANQGAAMGANLQSLYRNKIKGGVYKKGEQEFIQQIIPDNPAKWSSSFNAIPKVAQTISDNTNDLQTTAKSVGLNSPKQGGYPVEQGGGVTDGKTATNKKTGERLIFRNGGWEPYGGK